MEMTSTPEYAAQVEEINIRFHSLMEAADGNPVTLTQVGTSTLVQCKLGKELSVYDFMGPISFNGLLIFDKKLRDVKTVK